MLSIPLCYGKYAISSFISVKKQHVVKIPTTGNRYIIQDVPGGMCNTSGECALC
jgi:hypothetical protein